MGSQFHSKQKSKRKSTAVLLFFRKLIQRELQQDFFLLSILQPQVCRSPSDPFLCCMLQEHDLIGIIFLWRQVVNEFSQLSFFFSQSYVLALFRRVDQVGVIGLQYRQAILGFSFLALIFFLYVLFTVLCQNSVLQSNQTVDFHVYIEIKFQSRCKNFEYHLRKISFLEVCGRLGKV